MEHRIDSSSLNASEMEAMETLIRKGGRPALVDAEGNRTELPDAIYEMMVHLIQSMKQGRSVIMMPEDETFTTQAAANFLGVSRQHLVDLLEEGEIPFHKVGSHRRVYFRDLKEYADRRDAKRRETLDDLFDKVTKSDKYDTGYTGDER
jgi:excisionase family DNA binding protein